MKKVTKKTHMSKQLNMTNIAAFLKWYKQLQMSQKTGFIISAFSLLLLPFAVVAAQTTVRNQSKAKDATTPPPRMSPAPTPYPPKPGCTDVWWHDNISTNCQLRQICPTTTYQYYGLKTYPTLIECVRGLAARDRQ